MCNKSREEEGYICRTDVAKNINRMIKRLHSLTRRLFLKSQMTNGLLSNSLQNSQQPLQKGNFASVASCRQPDWDIGWGNLNDKMSSGFYWHDSPSTLILTFKALCWEVPRSLSSIHSVFSQATFLSFQGSADAPRAQDGSPFISLKLLTQCVSWKRFYLP